MQITQAVKKIASLKKRFRVVSGGTAAGKTIGILLWLIDYAQIHKNKLISVVSETFPHLKRGAIRDFLNIMEGHGLYRGNNWNKTESTYLFEETGSKIEFFSADQPGKVRGLHEMYYLSTKLTISLMKYIHSWKFVLKRLFGWIGIL